MQSKSNQKIKFGLEHNKKYFLYFLFFFKRNAQNKAGRLIPDFILDKSKSYAT